MGTNNTHAQNIKKVNKLENVKLQMEPQEGRDHGQSHSPQSSSTVKESSVAFHC